jgi:hypothetical protein
VKTLVYVGVCAHVRFSHESHAPQPDHDDETVTQAIDDED